MVDSNIMRVKLLSSTVLHQKWAQLTEYFLEYKRKDGDIELQRREVFYNGHGAAVLLYNTERRTIILVRQFRIVAWINKDGEDGKLVEVCAGLVENNDPLYTIKKEILEETGYQVKEIQFLYKAYPTPGAKDEVLYCYIASYSDKDTITGGGGNKDEQEDIEVMEVDFDTAVNWISEGKIIDLKTISLIQYAALHIFWCQESN